MLECHSETRDCALRHFQIRHIYFFYVNSEISPFIYFPLILISVFFRQLFFFFLNSFPPRYFLIHITYSYCSCFIHLKYQSIWYDNWGVESAIKHAVSLCLQLYFFYRIIRRYFETWVLGVSAWKIFNTFFQNYRFWTF